MNAGYFSSFDLQFFLVVLETTVNALRIAHRLIDYYVLMLSNDIRKLKALYTMNHLNMGMPNVFPLVVEEGLYSYRPFF